MTFGLYSIKDELSGYAAPIMLQDDSIADRYFRDLANNERMIAGSPKDFSIWKVGTYSTENGTIEPMEEKTLIVRAESVVKNG